MDYLDKALADTRGTPGLLANAMKDWFKEQGYPEDHLPPENVLNIFVTFCATVAIRTSLPPETTLRNVIAWWDKCMLNYSTSRVSHNPTCLMINEMSNEREPQPLILPARN